MSKYDNGKSGGNFDPTVLRDLAPIAAEIKPDNGRVSSPETNKEKEVGLKLEAGLVSVPGKYHEREARPDDRPRGNQDRGFCDVKNGVFAAFDGVGSLIGSERASQTAVETLGMYIRRNPLKGSPEESMHFSAERWLHQYFVEANERVFEITETSQRAAMMLSGYRNDVEIEGCQTVGVVAITYFENGLPYLAWGVVGDCRAYLIENDTSGKIKRLTDDNFGIGMFDKREIERIETLDKISVVDVDEIVKDSGEDSQKVLDLHGLISRGSIILQAIGTGDYLTYPAELHSGLALRQGMKIVLCSDGIYDNLSRDEICGVIQKSGSAKIGVKALVEKAQTVASTGALRSKDDDMTAVVIDVVEAASDVTKRKNSPKVDDHVGEMFVDTNDDGTSAFEHTSEYGIVDDEKNPGM
ncbi:MAG TPA: protein phosphatase 2C domain-containing protein [Candidatus Magasanikbacteria bacterium]|nr:protein phosphatase 2C domain-containing protein [Candidatus Magasanikbacteria bacterium]